MKIETRDVAGPPPQPRPARRADPGLIGRAAVVIVLAGFLIVALRWALNVTNANARQVSTSLANLQDGFEKSGTTTLPGGSVNSRRTPRAPAADDGPTLEPADSR